MTIHPNETSLVGKWAFVDGCIIPDEVCLRIENLINGHLRKLGHDRSGWDSLFVDPHDGRLWELIYPESSLHGGGPPELRFLTEEHARSKYGYLALKPE
ncbi:Imm27 family immunity protein [Pannonibacter phragmitetus]|uniref:Imm27 family immunity protein n=1 Tax=Pannonibacter phragmitetus TaxID=121719 RepID=UPI000F03F1C9